MKFGMQVCLGPGHIQVDGTQLTLPRKGDEDEEHPNFQPTAGWIKMTLGMEVGLGPGHIIVLDGEPAPLTKTEGTTPNIRPMSIVAKRLGGSRCHLV